MFHIPSYLSRNEYGIFHFRIAVPLHLRAYFKKKEIKRSLRTSDRREAIQRSRLIAYEVNNLFLEAQGDLVRKDWKNNRIYLTVDGIKRNANGSLEIAKVTMDPDKPEAEAKNFLAFMEAIKALDPVAYENAISSPPTPTPSSPPSILLETLMEEYISEKVREGSWTEKTLTEVRGSFKILVKIVGNVAMNTITFQHAREPVAEWGARA
ncbi:MAG: hypothetical protein HQL99_14515 [Magnetococcales bacterium]|nr:hypothetical protein [Magnetococcales bacterium]